METLIVATAWQPVLLDTGLMITPAEHALWGVMLVVMAQHAANAPLPSHISALMLAPAAHHAGQQSMLMRVLCVSVFVKEMLISCKDSLYIAFSYHF